MRSRGHEYNYTLGLVLRTGYLSYKGQMFRTVIYPVS